VRADGVQRELDALEGLGMAASELDLRRFASDPDGLDAALAGCDVVWARGGNVFVLRQALAACGADAALRALLARDGAVYGGYSAGVCILGPSLRGMGMVDDTDAALAHSGGRLCWDGLGVIDYAIVPHCDSPGHPETERCNCLAAHYRAHGVRHRALRDGEAIVVDGDPCPATRHAAAPDT
jgi:dipeptidase E